VTDKRQINPEGHEIPPATFGEGRKYTSDYVIEPFKSIRKETVEVCSYRSNIVTTPNEEQKRILQLLKIAI